MPDEEAPEASGTPEVNRGPTYPFNDEYTSHRPEDVLRFYDHFRSRDELITWMRNRPSGRAVITEVEGRKDLIVVIPTADIHGPMATRCREEVFKGQHIVFVESGGHPDKFFNMARNTNIGERPENGSVAMTALGEEPGRDGEPKVREEEVEGSVVVGAVGAPGLLRLNELRVLGVDRLAVVGDVVEVDGDIHGTLRDAGSGEFPKRPGECALRKPEVESREEAPGVSIRGPPATAGTGVGDGGMFRGRSEDQVGQVSASSRGEGMGQGRGEGGRSQRCA